MNLREEYNRNTKNVVIKQTSNPNLSVLKYKRTVFFNDTWNGFLQECRGLIIDKDWNIVSYPFTKIFNYGVETNAPVFDPQDEVIAMRKVNGFMAAITWYNNDLLISTTGSIDSEFVAKVRDFVFKTDEIAQKFKDLCSKDPNYTFMFECCHPSDPHIITEPPGLYYLGKREKKIGSPIELIHEISDAFLNNESLTVVEPFETTVADVLHKTRIANHEGFVFYHKDGRASKIKSPHYLSMKALMRANMDNFFKRNGRSRLDEEFYPLYDYINEHKEEFAALEEQDRKVWIEQYFRTMAK